MLFSKGDEVSREVCKKIGGGDWEYIGRGLPFVLNAMVIDNPQTCILIIISQSSKTTCGGAAQSIRIFSLLKIQLNL